MKNLIKTIFSRRNHDTSVDKKFTAVVADAYKKRAKEIESLRQYDLGNKDIDAPELKKVVRSV